MSESYTLYNSTVMGTLHESRKEHGDLKDADGVGEVGAAACGDIMKISLKIKNGRIEVPASRPSAVVPAIASSSMATELIKGRTIDEAMNSRIRRSWRPWADCPR